MKLIQELIALGQVPVTEGAMKDLHIDLLDAIQNEFDCNDEMTQAIADYLLDGADNQKVSEFLYDHFAKSGEMPYGVMKARTGDPDNWIADEMSQMFAKQLKAIWATEKTVKEDWGSSDWYAVFSSIEKDLKRGTHVDDAIMMAAEFYYDHMGYDNVTDAAASIKRVAKARKYPWIEQSVEAFESANAALKEFAPSKDDDSEDGFEADIAAMAKQEGFTKGASLADDQTLERGFQITNWDTVFGGLYKQHFADGWKEGRKDKLAHAIKTYGGSGKLLPNGAMKYLPKK